MENVHLSIVIPVFNEEDNLEPLQQEIERRVEPLGFNYEVIYIDDGSRDRSYERLVELHAARPDIVRVIQLRRNFGQTAAMAAGFDAARGEIIVPMDADLQNDPADIAPMLELLDEGHDIVSGWRVERREPFLTRRLPSKIANMLISRMTGVRLHDYGCTLKAYRRETIQDMRIYGEMHRFLPALATWTGAHVAEIKVNDRQRQHGKTKYGLGRTRRVLLDLITVRFLLSHSTHPMYVFGKWGLRALFLGICSGAILAYQKIVEHQDITNSGYLYMMIFLFLGGLQLLCMGLLGEINVRTYYESQQRTTYSVRRRLGAPDPVARNNNHADTSA